MSLIKALTLLIVILFSISFSLKAKNNTIILHGKVTTSEGKSLSGATIGITGYTKITITGTDGKFKMSIPSSKEAFTINVRFIGYKTHSSTHFLNGKDSLNLNITLIKKSITGKTIIISEESNKRDAFITEIKTKDLKEFITPSGNNIEAVIKTLPGVSSNNELSSQYNVRGGNFDENLIYVNNIEIYRPFLVKSGSKEGLSFINSDMVEKIEFSAGGFEAKYGDKMSSVLSITYKTPTKPTASINMDLQGVNLFYGNSFLDNKLSFITSARFKTNAYVLSALNTKGSYRPSFLDLQTYINYKLHPKFSIGFLGNLSQNSYQFTPKSRKTSFGSVNEALQLSVFFNGQEIDQFSTYFGSLISHYKPSRNLDLKFILSSFSSIESQNKDIEGFYKIDELEKDLGSDNFGGVKSNRGIGSFLDHSRNDLYANISNIEHQGKLFKSNGNLEWGVKLQHENIRDNLKDWNYIDSAGYSRPSSPTTSKGKPFNPRGLTLKLNDVLSSNHQIKNLKIESYLQKTWKWSSQNLTRHYLKLGARVNYRSYFKEFLHSYRGSYSLKPNWKKSYTFKVAGGIYYQPPFYREIRDFDGSINPNVRAQKSYQIVLGAEKNFKLWNRPFKFTTEAYYKDLHDLIPYQIDNVRIRYHASNNSRGYATGIDFRLNGEFVKNIESWVSLSIMDSKENLIDDFYFNYFNSDGKLIIPGFTTNNIPVDSVRVEPGYLPRPTNQLVNFSLFFQDYIKSIPRVKVGIVFHYGSGLPYGPPLARERYKYTARYPDYLRADLRLSYDLRSRNDSITKGPLKIFKNVAVSLQFFNLLQVNNVISYLWLQDVSGRQYAVPNYLTSRQISVSLTAKF